MEKTDLKIDFDAAAGIWFAEDANGKRVATDATYVGLIAKLNAKKPRQ